MFSFQTEPCSSLIMRQDKSREFSHFENNKDKFKAALLQQVNDLLVRICIETTTARGIVEELEASINKTNREGASIRPHFY
ncbi:P-loop nucleoside triphosphate hydrolase superfamily protein, putative [Medicago truncatula]|uniref:P-loop nucleoside triphosphate hydrolase superfamily protein, putative n=1 Tax=Medicago truncatula TaxID=3880 RepID=G7ICE5_MEDTR|nr:P-loop nucleoside triphosphate hydrolase superfamily protein, putative [Medicago truncatula]